MREASHAGVVAGISNPLIGIALLGERSSTSCAAVANDPALAHATFSFEKRSAGGAIDASSGASSRRR